MILGTIVSQVLVSWCPVVAEVFLGVAALESCPIPRWDSLPSGHQRYPLLGLNLGYMYWGQKHFSE